MANRVIERNSSFGPTELGYFPIGAGSEWYTKWYPSDPPRRGFKIHVTARAEDAEIVARSVLPKLRARRIPHKVVRDLQRYRQLLAGPQQGKFVTVYLPGPPAAELVQALESELVWLISRPGPRPTAIGPGGVRVPEEQVGSTGNLFGRAYDETAPD